MAVRLTLRTAAVPVVCLLAACMPQQDPAPAVDASAAVRADILWFEEQEAGVEAYPVRVLVTAAHVRVDDDLDDGDYILYERATGSIHSVTREDRTVLELSAAPAVPAVPEDLRIEAVDTVDEQAPTMAGRQPVVTTISANGTPCYQLVRVPGVLEAGLAGVAEYARALGNRQLARLDTLLPGEETPCFLARHVYAADRPYTGGLPVRMWDAAGYLRTLVDFSRQDSVSSELFSLPDGYSSYRIGGSGP